MDEKIKVNELYYWTNEKGETIPKHELSDLYVCNIVAKYGKMWLRANGHNVIVDRFEALNKKYGLFNRFREVPSVRGENN